MKIRWLSSTPKVKQWLGSNGCSLHTWVWAPSQEDYKKIQNEYLEFSISPSTASSKNNWAIMYHLPRHGEHLTDAFSSCMLSLQSAKPEKREARFITASTSMKRKLSDKGPRSVLSHPSLDRATTSHSYWRACPPRHELNVANEVRCRVRYSCG